jgi:predicted DCC family thiol-disulfide oxidoreductase YuxK
MSRGVVLFDGLCPLCRKVVGVLTRLDWRGRLHFQDCRDTARLPRTSPPLDPAKLLDEMHLVTPAGRVHAGYAAVRWIAWRVPLMWPLAPLLYLPGVPWLGHRAYLWVARRRYRLVPCNHGVCQLPPRPGS